MRSEENSIQRLQIIKQAQTGLYQEVSTMVAAGSLTPEIYTKIKKPYADTLYVLGVKDCDTYLPSDKEVADMIAAAQKAAANKEPTPDDQAKLAKAKLDTVKAAEIEAEVAGNTASQQLEGYSLIKEGKARAYAP
jgi:hypothetical protein